MPDNFTIDADSGASDDLTSIIIATAGQLEHTRLCVQSILKYSRAACELIFVDIASLDGTLEFLQGIETASNVPVTIVRLTREHTFASAYSIGLEHASGRYVILLQNDTVVTSKWVSQMIGLAAHDQTIGVVGAMSNHSPPPQNAGPVPYRIDSLLLDEESASSRRAAIEAVDAYARRWREEHSKKWFEVEFVNPICLLLKREVLDAIGTALAPASLGIDAIDLCHRVRQAGYRIACCQDLFIHHFATRVGWNTNGLPSFIDE